MRTRAVRLMVGVGLVALASGRTALAQVPSPNKDPQARWFQATPYLWLASIQGENSIGSVTVPIDVNFGDILSNLKFAYKADQYGIVLGVGFHF